MSETVWKFIIDIKTRQTVLMPEGAIIRHAGTQGDVTTLWAQVNPTAPPVRRHIEIFGTGHPMDEAERDYIGTTQMAGGALIWHIFERLT